MIRSNQESLTDCVPRVTAVHIVRRLLDDEPAADLLGALRSVCCEDCCLRQWTNKMSMEDKELERSSDVENRFPELELCSVYGPDSKGCF